MRHDKPAVYFDGACPLCRREIGFYQNRRGAQDIDWVDVSKDDARLPDGLELGEARARFHVQTDNGTVISGGSAFAYLWTLFPAFRWAGRIGSTKPVAWLLEQGYRFFLKFRPRLQRLVSRSS